MPRPATTWQYIYGIIRGNEPALFDVEGIEGPAEVYTVGAGDLAVVTSGIARESLRGLGRAEAVQYLSRHQRVLETVMQDYPVLPAKFGTILAGEAQLRALLRQGARLLRETLAEYAGKQQIEVVALWDLGRVFQEIAAEEPIAALKAQIAGRTPEESVAERIAVGQLVHAALQRRRAATAAQMLAQLRDLADDVIVNPTMDDSMVTNLALLLPEERRDALDVRLEILDEQHRGQLNLRCIGPLPPYSFASLEVQALSWEAVEVARQQLGLDEQASYVRLKRAYRQLAAQAHPDHNQSDEFANARMEALTDAYRLLDALARAQAPTPAGDSSPPQDWPCRFDRAVAEETLLLNVVRQEGAS